MAGIAPETIGLRIGSREWRAWSGVCITRSMEQLASSATLKLTSIDWKSTGADLLDVIPGSFCELWIGNSRADAERVFTGYLDSDESDTRKGREYSLTARSKTADLVDCTVVHPSGVFRGLTPRRIMEELAAPYGVDVLSEVADGDPVANFRASKTEKVASAIGRLLKERGLLALDDSLGNLVIAEVAQPGPVVAVLEYGKSFETASRARDLKGRHAEYVVRGQTADDFGAQAVARDEWLTRRRTLALDCERSASQADCLRRAAWEATTRAGKSVRYTVTVGGWRTSPVDPLSALWDRNQLVRLRVPQWEVDDDLLVVEATLSRAPTTATLTLGYPEGYQPDPVTGGKYYRGTRKAPSVVPRPARTWV